MNLSQQEPSKTERTCKLRPGHGGWWPWVQMGLTEPAVGPGGDGPGPRARRKLKG
jgi:hypothetical protein